MISNRTIGLSFAAIGMLLLSTRSVLIKLAFELGASTVELIFFRMLFALPVYLVMLIWLCAQRPRLSLQDFFGAFGLGLLGYYVATYLDFAGLNYISAQLERIIFFSYPAIIVIVTAIYSRAYPSRRKLAALLFTFTGIALVFGHDIVSLGNGSVLGALLVLAAAISFASYMMGSKGLMARIGSARFTAISMLAASGGVLVHSTVVHFSGIVTISFDQPQMVYVYSILLAIVSTILPSYLIADAIHRLNPTLVAIIGNLGPIATSLLAVWILSEPFTVFHAIGFILVFVGISVMVKPMKSVKSL